MDPTSVVLIVYFPFFPQVKLLICAYRVQLQWWSCQRSHHQAWPTQQNTQINTPPHISKHSEQQLKCSVKLIVFYERKILLDLSHREVKLKAGFSDWSSLMIGESLRPPHAAQIWGSCEVERAPSNPRASPSIRRRYRSLPVEGGSQKTPSSLLSRAFLRVPPSVSVDMIDACVVCKPSLCVCACV